MRSRRPRGWCLNTSRIEVNSEVNTEVSIERESQLEPNELDQLVSQSLEEGFKFVQRLRDEYQSGVNRFDQLGEALLLAREASNVIAVIGLNLDPEGQPGLMRLRRFYVLPEHRGHGLGKKMLLEVIELARKVNAKFLELHTDNWHAARFYDRNGFQALNSNNPTHRLEF
jgi:GNAT superfamily N-acetyltransferase